MKKEYDKNITKITYIVAAIVVLLITYYLFAKPYLTFKSYENQAKEAGKRYFEINPNEMPTGKRVGTVSLFTLFNQKYIYEDFKVPLTSKLCNLKDSWVKVKYEDNDYKYYTYIDCGYMESKVDHEGPVIKLNGDQEMTLSKYEKFQDPGIKSVIDKNDGKLKISDVIVSGEVKTETAGEYTIKYAAYDSLKNYTEVTRKVTVIDTITSVTKRANSKGFYPGDAINNYILFSNQLYRIYGVEGDNVKIASDEAVGIVNFSALDKQLEKYYKSLSPKSRKLIVKARYCDDKLSAKNLDTTGCSSYTKEKYVYVPSIEDINRINVDEDNYLVTPTTTWTSNGVKDGYQYISGSNINYVVETIVSTKNTNNVGIRTMITIKGDSIISGGDGSLEDPYILKKDVTRAETGEKVHDRLPGEYITMDGERWRIIEPQKDGTTKIIMVDNVSSSDSLIKYPDKGNDIYEYNPKKINTYAYYLNNKANTYISTSYITSHEIEVPIYKDKILYGKEKKTKKYKVKLSAQNMYDLYTVSNGVESLVINTSEDLNEFYATTSSGNVIKKTFDPTYKFAIKPVAYLKSDVVISSGEGRADNPYSIK